MLKIVIYRVFRAVFNKLQVRVLQGISSKKVIQTMDAIDSVIELLVYCCIRNSHVPNEMTISKYCTVFSCSQLACVHL
jgi:hypothetical protein